MKYLIKKLAMVMIGFALTMLLLNALVGGHKADRIDPLYENTQE